MKGLCILGATGSIGVSTLDVALRHPDQYKIIALTANTNADVLYQQCLKHTPEFAVMVCDTSAQKLQAKLRQSNSSTQVLSGAKALEKVAALPQVDSVMAAIVGAAGLLPSLAAASAGKTILLANKEALVMSGKIFMQAVQDGGATLLPIDSEHNAIFQCMPADYKTGKTASEVRRILLTASGGPFRLTPIDQMPSVTVSQAVAHPKWDMGAKISTDSATMMNKGLELIEACLLFNISPDAVTVVIHPQSIIHSMVDYIDGSVLAQMGNPDMRIPIAFCLAAPKRFQSGVAPLDIFAVKQMDFSQPDLARFPCLALAHQACKTGGNMPTVLNAANEIAVAAFLAEQIKFTDIAKFISQCMHQFTFANVDNLQQVLQTDADARAATTQLINASH